MFTFSLSKIQTRYFFASTVNIIPPIMAIVKAFFEKKESFCTFFGFLT